MDDRWGSRETPVMKSITAKQRYGTPPTVGSLSYWKPTVPSWEKEFCASVCFIPWSKVLETKKIMSLYANVVRWDDSAGEEAFTNAKKRFWAKINDLPCDVSLPDPDIYIDRIDWDSIAAAATDPELLNSMEEEIGEGDRLEVLSIIWENQDINAIPCSGWGDEDDDNQVRAATTQNKDGRFEQNSWDACEIHPNQDKGNAPIRSSGWGDAGVQDSPGAASGWGEEFDDWAPEKYQQEIQRLIEFSNWERVTGPMVTGMAGEEKGAGCTGLGITKPQGIGRLPARRSRRTGEEDGGIGLGRKGMWSASTET